MPSPTRGDWATYDEHPDNREDKEVFLQASGLSTGTLENPRHVFICWLNTPMESDNDPAFYQIIQLEKRGNHYHYCYPLVKKRVEASINSHQTWSLGTFTFEQRDMLLELAEDVEFEAGSLRKGCRVWMAKLLREMRREQLIDQSLLTAIFSEVPLPPIYTEGDLERRVSVDSE